MSLNAYQRTRSMVEQPRAVEQRLIGEITGVMIEARERGLRGAALMPALHRNREMWNAFSTACASAGNQLPDALRAGIISLALWVDRYTSDVVAGRDSVDDLISLNRQISEGLAGKAIA